MSSSTASPWQIWRHPVRHILLHSISAPHPLSKTNLSHFPILAKDLRPVMLILFPFPHWVSVHFNCGPWFCRQQWARPLGFCITLTNQCSSHLSQDISRSTSYMSVQHPAIGTVQGAAAKLFCSFYKLWNILVFISTCFGPSYRMYSYRKNGDVLLGKCWPTSADVWRHDLYSVPCPHKVIV